MKPDWIVCLVMAFLGVANAEVAQNPTTEIPSYIPWEHRQDPPTADELKQIRKMVDAIDSGKVRDLLWWAEAYEAVPKGDAITSETTLRKWLDLYYEKELQQCPTYERDGRVYGCTEDARIHLKNDLTKLFNELIDDWDTPITTRTTRFEIARGDRTKAWRTRVTRTEFLVPAKGRPAKRKVIQLKISLETRLRIPLVPTHGYMLPDKKIPFRNLEIYSLPYPDALAFSSSWNVSYYATPCRLASILNSECTPPEGLLGFHYFYIE